MANPKRFCGDEAVCHSRQRERLAVEILLDWSDAVVERDA
jgi:hypothetical protein